MIWVIVIGSVVFVIVSLSTFFWMRNNYRSHSPEWRRQRTVEWLNRDDDSTIYLGDYPSAERRRRHRIQQLEHDLEIRKP